MSQSQVVPCWGGPRQFLKVGMPPFAAWNELFQLDGGRYVLQHSPDGSAFYLWEGRLWPLSRDTLEAMWRIIPGQPFHVRARLWLLRWWVNVLLPKPVGDIPAPTEGEKP